MEYFDIVDEKGVPTGAIVERTEAHRTGARHRTVHIWIVREKEGRTEVLLQKRAQGKDSFPGCYDTSSAGHITAGDEPDESAIRELGEELGLEAKPEDLEFIGNFDVDFQKEFHGTLFIDKEVVFVYLYRGQVNTEELKLQVEEVERVDWFDLEEAITKCKAHDPAFCVPMKGFQTLAAHLGRN